MLQPTPSPLLDRAAAAAYLGLAVATLETWASSRRYSLPFVKLGRRVMYRRADLDAFIESRTRGA
jgi:excisionase family DNA binding protein